MITIITIIQTYNIKHRTSCQCWFRGFRPLLFWGRHLSLSYSFRRLALEKWTMLALMNCVSPEEMSALYGQLSYTKPCCNLLQGYHILCAMPCITVNYIVYTHITCIYIYIYTHNYTITIMTEQDCRQTAMLPEAPRRTWAVR